jgi:hypothetical protein
MLYNLKLQQARNHESKSKEPYTAVCCLMKEWKRRRTDPLGKTEDGNREKTYQQGEEGCFFSCCDPHWTVVMGKD